MTVPTPRPTTAPAPPSAPGASAAPTPAGAAASGARWRTDRPHAGPATPHVAPTSPSTSPETGKRPEPEATTNAAAMDPQLVDAVRKEIVDLAAEVADAARSDRPPQAFFELLLSRAITATASRGGAIWHLDATGEPLLWCEAAFRSRP